MSSPDVHTLTGAYVLDALSEFERHQFQAHLSVCPDCAREVAELRDTAAKLGVAVATRPPDSLRRAVLAQVKITRQDSPAGRAADTATRVADRTGWASWGVRLTATAAAVAVAAAAVVALGVANVRAEHERDATRSRLAQMRAQYAPVAQVAAAPDARGGAGAGARGGTVFVLVSQRLDKAVLLVSGLPTPPRGRIYQVWLIGHGHLRSVGLLTVNPSTPAPPLRITDLTGSAKVGLTIEPAGGSPQPTTNPVVLFDLPT